MNKLAIFSGAALLAIAGAALAQGPAPVPAGPDGPRRAPMADMTRQQASARADAMFARLDANHDGRFTPDEAGALRRHRDGDGDGDGDRAGAMFDRLDANHDGNLSRDEFARAHAMRGPGGHHGRRMGPPPGGPDGDDMGPPPPPGGPGGPGMRGQRMFGAEGFVTAEQFRARALERFDRADADHDGTVTVAERQAMRGQRRGPRGAPEAPPAN